MSRMFVPGPVDVADEVLAAQTKPMIPHRSKDFEATFRKCDERLRQVFFTERPVYISSSSGSGLQEAGIRNFANETVLSCVNGAFAKRWYDVAVVNGKQADKLEVPWGEVIKPDQLADALKQKHYEVVTIVHNETSTGAENPVKELAKVVHETSPDTLILVDAVSSLSGTKIEFDAWGLDFLLTSSQKCFALPPGLAFGAASERAMKKAETVKFRGWYFDLLLSGKTSRQRLHPNDACHVADLGTGCSIGSNPGRRFGETLCTPRGHGKTNTGLGSHPGNASAGSRRIPLQDGFNHQQYPKYGYSRPQ